MKILVICHIYLLKENRRKIEELAEIPGTEVHLIVPDGWPDYIRKINGFEPGGKNNFKTHMIRAFCKGKESAYFYRSLSMKLKEIKPDIIYVEQGAKALSYMQTLIFKKIFSGKSGTGFFTWVNINYTNRFPHSLVEKFNLNNSDFAIAGNSDAKKILEKHGAKFPIEIIPQLGVDEKLFKKTGQTKLKKELGLKGFVVGFVGRFDMEKGLDTLLHAVSGLKNYSILMVGTGKDKDRLFNIANDLGISDKIRTVDVVPIQELPKYYNCMDVFVLPSKTGDKWKEQFGHVLIEAMSCEVPVIGSDSGDIPNVIGDAGLIFREGDAGELRKKISLLQINGKERAMLAKKARRRVLEKYTHKKISGNVYGLFKKILEGG